MKLFEYQAKQIFKDAGIAVPRSVLVEKAENIDEAVFILGLPCVLKCQVLSGGRGKAGLVKLVNTEKEAQNLTEQYFSQIPSLHAVLVEEAVDFTREIYLAITMDARSGKAVLMGCAMGGIDIEIIAMDRPKEIERELIDLDEGLQTFAINDFVYRLGLRDSTLKKISAVCTA